jgi:hypothetical protein
MNYLLLDIAAFTIRAHGLVVRAVLRTVPLNLDRSYVDDDLMTVVFIIDTTYTLASSGSVCQSCVPAPSSGLSDIQSYRHHLCRT